MIFDKVNGMAVIDISDVQGARGINFDEAQAAGLWGVLIKLGSGDDLTEQDSDYFETAVAEAEKRGIHWGAWLYSYAMSPAEVPSEIAHCKRRLAGKCPTLPIYYDMEDADGYKRRHGGIPDRQTITDMIGTFCVGMEDAGYFVGWYCNLDWLKNHVNADQLKKWTFWYARPGVDSPEGHPAMWQNGIGETGSTWLGVPGLCDTDRCYENFPEEIKAAGLNGWDKFVPAPTPAPAQAPQPAPAPAHAHSIGENVVFSTCYSSSTDPTSEAIDANRMARNHGVITSIRDGAQNPYLLDGGLCWVNDGDIRGQHSEAAHVAQASPTPQPVIYVVEPNDTLGGIAAKYGTTYQHLAQVNGIANPNLIGIGQKIIIK